MPNLIIYLLIFIALLAFIASVLTMNVYLVFFCALCPLIIFFLYKLWDLFESLIIKKTGAIQLLGLQELAGDRNSAIRDTPNGFQAISAAVLRDFPKKDLSKEGIERIICSSNSPFRLVVQVERLNTNKIIENLKTKRRMKEIELSKTKRTPGKDNTNVIEREILLIEDEISAISTGSIPLKTEIYLVSSAVSESKFAAEERSLSQIKELSGEFSAVLGAGFEIVNGSELIRLIKADSLCVGV